MSIDGIGYDGDFDSLTRTFGGSVGGSASAEGKTDGSSRVEAEAHVSRENDDGSRVSGSVGGSVDIERDGKCTAGGKAEVSWEKPFSLPLKV